MKLEIYEKLGFLKKYFEELKGLSQCPLEELKGNQVMREAGDFDAFARHVAKYLQAKKSRN